MNLTRHRRRIERRSRYAGDWKPRDAGEAENRLFDCTFSLAEAARELEATAGAAGSASATTAALGCATSAFESIANATQKMRGAVVSDSSPDGIAGSEEEELAMLLHAISHNLRIAAELAERGRRVSAEVAWSRFPSP